MNCVKANQLSKIRQIVRKSCYIYPSDYTSEDDRSKIRKHVVKGTFIQLSSRFQRVAIPVEKRVR